mgnify:FL=1
MAKKLNPDAMGDIFSSTTSGQKAPEKQPDKPQETQRGKRAVGVNLSHAEIAELDRIAREGGEKRGTLLTAAVQKFIADFQAGKIPTEPGKRLKL